MNVDSIFLLRQMWLCRVFEETVSELFAKGEVRGLIHLGIGQEAVAVGIGSSLSKADYLYGSHRAHCHALGKGADPKRLLAEIAGRATGYCKGKGGSMHIMARDVGFLGATGVVGGNIPLALGSAFACKARGGNDVVAVCFGDGTAQVGYFHESLNIAALWKLPVIFICENNGWGEFSPLSTHTVVAHLSDHARTYGMPQIRSDGNDVLAVGEAVQAAIDTARAGHGPTLVELTTYRLRGHYEGDNAKYRDASQTEEWKARDPILRYQKNLLSRKLASNEQIAGAERTARDTVRDAVRFTLESPLPASGAVIEDVYVASMAPDSSADRTIAWR